VADQPTCETCRYFREMYLAAKGDPTTKVLAMHKCHRYPEAVDARVTGWCGEHKARPVH
jgi:hypothetical protein